MECIAKNFLYETVLFAPKPSSASYACKIIIKGREVIQSKAVWIED